MYEENLIQERYSLSIGRIRSIVMEETVSPIYREYFQTVAQFILNMDAVFSRIQRRGQRNFSFEEFQEENSRIYQDLIGDSYQTSYANPTFAVQKFGVELGQLLSFLYTEIRGEVAYTYEQKQLQMTILNELFIEIYNYFEQEDTPSYKELRDVIYWYASDYCDVFVAEYLEEQMNPECAFAIDLVMQSDLSDLRYLYQYGEYISEKEIEMAQSMNRLSQEEIEERADSYLIPYLNELEAEGVAFSNQPIVNIQYSLGNERVVRRVIEKMRAIGICPTACRYPYSVLTRESEDRIGYYGVAANLEYKRDHNLDQGLFLDKKIVERKIGVIKNTYEKQKALVDRFAGTFVIDAFDMDFLLPPPSKDAICLNGKQQDLYRLYLEKTAQISNKYL